jgi:hypothetical protein
MQAAAPTITRIVAGLIGILWCYIEPSLNYISVCFFALVLDCYTAWRCNRRIYSRYREAIKRNPKCKMDGKLRSKKMAKMVQDFSVLIMAIFLAVIIDNDLLAHMGELHLANYLAVIYCSVQFVSILENESTCNGAAWARVVQKIVADKTERHFNIKLKELMADVENMEKSDADASTENTPNPDPETETNPNPQEDK